MTKYLDDDGSAFAFDLTEAANRQDWRRYREVQQMLNVETTQAMAQRAFQAEQGRYGAIEEVSKSHPGFSEVYGSQEWQQTLRAHPTLAEAVGLAESNPDYQGEQLVGLYAVAYESLVGKQIAQGRGQVRRQPVEPIFHETMPTEWTEQAIFGATQDSKQHDISTSAKRNALIEQLLSTPSSTTQPPRMASLKAGLKRNASKGSLN